ncbi:MAG TPA: AAA family ATPase [Polyangia bacterium]|nr:AAA family ATPase [Polyangia bacterium]
MISRAIIRNFRCLASVDVDFEPLTILVGPNASGKSSLISTLRPDIALDGTNAWRNKGSAVIEVISEGRRTPIRSASHAFQLLHLDVEKIRYPNVVQEARRLDETGTNLTNVFATLTREEQNALVAHFTKLVPMYRDVATRPSPQNPGNHRLVFQDRWSPELWYEPTQVSDGSMLMLALLLVEHQPQPVDVIAIEEPERGLHPYLLGKLIESLRDLALGRLGPKTIQVILATHSAELLEFALPHEVRFVSRRESDGTTQVERAPTESADWAKSVREYEGSLGGLWLSGALGGVPGG